MKKYPFEMNPAFWFAASAVLMALLQGAMAWPLWYPLGITAGVMFAWWIGTRKLRKELREANRSLLRPRPWTRFTQAWIKFWKKFYGLATEILTNPIFWTGASVAALIWAAVCAMLLGYADLQLWILSGCLVQVIVTILRSIGIESRRQLDEHKKELDSKIAQADARIGRLNNRETSLAKEVALRATYAALGCTYAFGQIDLVQAMVHYLNLSGEVRQMNVRDYLQFRNITPTQDLPTVCLLAICERTKREGTTFETYDIVNHRWIGWHDADLLWKIAELDETTRIVTMQDSAYPRSTPVRLRYPAGEIEEATKAVLKFVGLYTSSAHLAHEMVRTFGVRPLATADGDRNIGMIRVALQLGQEAFELESMDVDLAECQDPKPFLSVLLDNHDPGRDTPIQ